VRILVCAFACAPLEGSEPGAGWAVVQSSAEAGHHVTVVTARHNRSAMEQGLRARADIRSRIHVEYVGMSTRLFRAWDRMRRPGKQLHYLLCQHTIAKISARLHAERPFDVAHHVTIAADFMPCGMSRVAGLPLVWGPVGGAQHIPDACRPWLGRRGRSLELARRILADPLRLTGGLRTARRAALVVAQNADAAQFWSNRGIKSTTRPNVFLHDPDRDVVVPPPWNDGSEHRRAVFVGRLVAWKGVHLALTAMAEPAAVGWELHFFGTGPEEKRLGSGIRDLGLEGRVHLHGQRSRREIRAVLPHADALLFPSMRDSAPWAVGEALWAGCPVVCLRTAGAAELVRRGGGVAVDPTDALPRRLAEALAATATSPRVPVQWSATELSALLPEWYERAMSVSVGR
jgi:glycosyltransferase involved in cell wall biosynthesis